MKKLFIVLTAGLLITPAFADVKFKCSYSDTFQVEKRGKVKTRYGKPIVKISGELSESAGGKLSLRSAYLYGTKAKQRVQFYRHNRDNEGSLKFAKFHNKSPKQIAEKAWLPTYVRFSIPKKSLKGEEKQFPAYFGYFRAKGDVNSIGSDDPQATEVEVTEEDLKEFAKENEQTLEYKLWCKKTII